MLGRFFFIGLLLIGGAAIALFSTRTGYNVSQRADGEQVVCSYWIGFGLAEKRFDPPAASPVDKPFECPLILRDIVL